MNVAVFISGSGTNLKALCEEERIHKLDAKKMNWQISVVFTNVKGCDGIKIAKSYNKKVVTFSSKKFFNVLQTNHDDESRVFYDAAVISLIEHHNAVDLIVLAGYRRKLSKLFHNYFKNKIINLYPGDITKPYLTKGVDASIQAIRNKEKNIKASVYVDQPDCRFGIPLLQSDFISLENYSEQDKDLINRIIREEAEWKIFPYAVNNLIASGKISIDKNNKLYYNNKKIPENGLQINELKDNIIL